LTLAQTPAGSAVQKIQTKDLTLMLFPPVFKQALRDWQAQEAGLKHHTEYEAQMDQIRKSHEETPAAPPAYKNASLSKLKLLGDGNQLPSKRPGFGDQTPRFVSHKKQKISKTPTRVPPSRKVNQAPRGNLQKSLKARQLDTLVTRRKLTKEALIKQHGNKDSKLSPKIQSQKVTKKISKTAAVRRMDKAIEDSLEENNDINYAQDDSQPKSE
jgi:hypothetical protein